MIKRLRLSYKGDRDYLHGSDFFNCLSDMAGVITGDHGSYIQKMSFRRFALNACNVSIRCPNDLEAVVGEVNFKAPALNLDVCAWIVESDYPVIDRRPFDETTIVERIQSDLSLRTATLSRRSEYTPIEEIIAVTKHLNYTVVPSVQGKWVFGQLGLNEPLLANYQNLEIRMVNLVGERFSANDIFVDGRKIGTIQFIVGRRS